MKLEHGSALTLIRVALVFKCQLLFKMILHHDEKGWILILFNEFASTSLTII